MLSDELKPDLSLLPVSSAGRYNWNAEYKLVALYVLVNSNMQCVNKIVLQSHLRHTSSHKGQELFLLSRGDMWRM